MMCEYCEIINSKKAAIVYEDDKCIAFLAERPVAAGHVIVAPKTHTPIFEEIGDELIGHCFNIATKLSVAVFEAIGAKGTNMIVHNGVEGGQQVAHFCINIISRRENDGIDFKWAAKQISEEEMSMIEKQIKEYLEKGEEAIDVEEKSVAIDVEKKKSNYLLKQLRRIP